MARSVSFLGGVLILLVSLSVPLYGYGAATHAYIAHRLDDQQGPADLTRIYGALLPDAFNLAFDDPYQNELWMLTHYEFMKLVESAESDQDRALAYGFASHSEAWGADRTAHISATDQPGEGYVIRKQDELVDELEPKIRLFLLLNGVSDASSVIDEVLPTVAHAAIETAVDLLVCQNEDPDIGQRLLMAARTRGWSAPILLCKAYAADLAATAGTTEAVASPLMVAAESEFRQQMILYGTALMQEDPAGTLSDQGADLAEMLLGAELGIVIDIPADLMMEVLDMATNLVKNDYAAELAATITQVQQELEAHGVAAASF